LRSSHAAQSKQTRMTADNNAGIRKKQRTLRTRLANCTATKAYASTPMAFGWLAARLPRCHARNEQKSR